MRRKAEDRSVAKKKITTIVNCRNISVNSIVASAEIEGIYCFRTFMPCYPKLEKTNARRALFAPPQLEIWVSNRACAQLWSGR